MAEVYDAQIHHPFTSIVSGPSGCGKSTFVAKLMRRQNDIIDTEFDYVTIVIGTDASVNPILSNLKHQLKCKVRLVELKKKYQTLKQLNEKFPADLKEHLEVNSKEGKKKGCIIFDDVMTELSECGLLVDLFTKYSSHYGISVIFITQNLFFKSSGKHAGDHVTLYRNTHVLVVFQTPMDNIVLNTLAHRLQTAGSARLLPMLAYILEHHRYVVVFGKLGRPSEIRFMTDIFATDPVPHQKVFQLVGE